MKNSSLWWLLLAVLTGLSSCQKEWLEAKSDAKLTVPSTLIEFQGLLDDVLNMSFIDSDLGEIASDGHFITEESYVNTPEGQRKDAYTWTKKGTYAEDEQTDWLSAYKKILYCNIVLEGLEKFNPQNQIEKSEMNNIKGQALFQRALTFFQLTQLYSPPHNSSEPDSEYGIILRLNTDITQTSKRSTVQKTYEQILTDLKAAATLLEDKPKILTRGSKMAVYALLSRIFLCLGEYSQSLDYSNKCLSIHSNLINFNTLPTSAIAIGLFNDEVIFHSYLQSSSFITYNCLFDSAFYNQYDENDLRRSIYFSSSNGGTFTFKGNYGDNNFQMFNGFATDEILLNRSECLARRGKYQEAMNDLNTLLKSRWDANIDYVEKSAANAEEAIQLILFERKKSLLLRGIRWMDLRRLNKEGRFITLSRTVSGQTYILEPNSYQYAFPIPDVIITQTGIKQNPGWE